MTLVEDVFETYQGDDDPFELEFIDKKKEEIDITNYGIQFSVKEALLDEVLIEKSSENINEIEKTDPVHGIAIVYICSMDTEYLDVGSYEYDVQIIINGNKHTYKKGIFVIKGEVSK